MNIYKVLKMCKSELGILSHVQYSHTHI